MKALVLAGGRGASMTPFSATRPNPMIPIAGEYAIDRTITKLKEAGVNTVNIVLGHKGEVMREHLAADHSSGVTINFVDQGKSQEIGKAILSARDMFSPGEHFLLVYADTLTTSNIFGVIQQSFGLHNEATAAIALTSSGEKYGNVYLGQGMKITKLIEKPNKKEKLGNYVLAGVFVMPASFFDHLDRAGGSMEKALKGLVKKGLLRASIWEDDWLDLAYPWDILTANKSIMDTWRNAEIHKSVVVRDSAIAGPVHIAEGATICSGAVLEGPSYIGPGTYIGHNVLIRPYTCIGANSVIGQSSELKNCSLFQNTTVGRLSFIGDSVIGEKADLGALTMTINRLIDLQPVYVTINRKKIETGFSKLGAFIGDGAVIGASNTISAGAVITNGKVIDHNISAPKSGRQK